MSTAWLGGVGGDGVFVLCGREHRVLGGGPRESPSSGSGSACERAAFGRKYGRQRSALWNCELGAFRHGYNRRELRGDQCSARLVYAARRDGAAGEHHAG